MLEISLRPAGKPQRSKAVVPALAGAALIALAACGPVASPSSTTDLGRSASAPPAAPVASSGSVVVPSPQTSGEGVAQILFTRTLDGQDLQTYTIGIDGSRETQLTNVTDCCGAWSPDGSIIAVPDKLASSRLLPATINADGTAYTVHPIGSPTVNLAPTGWSPGGDRFLFEGWDDTDPSHTGLYVSKGFTPTDAVPVQITQALLHDIALTWSPDGTRLLLIQVTRCPDGDCDGGDLYVAEADGSDLIRLNPEGTFVACCGPADWSPDGTQVAFGAQRLNAAGAADFTRSAVYLADADGSRVEAITGLGAFTEDARWSPNGEWIVFSKKSGPVGMKGSDLYLVHPDGSELHAITSAGAAGESDQFGARWSPDGSRLLFHSVPGGSVKRGDLWLVDPDGTNLSQLTDSRAQYWAYSWQPRP